MVEECFEESWLRPLIDDGQTWHGPFFMFVDFKAGIEYTQSYPKATTSATIWTMSMRYIVKVEPRRSMVEAPRSTSSARAVDTIRSMSCFSKTALPEKSDHLRKYELYLKGLVMNERKIVRITSAVCQVMGPSTPTPPPTKTFRAESKIVRIKRSHHVMGQSTPTPPPTKTLRAFLPALLYAIVPTFPATLSRKA
jgi:hypothetical protein